MHTIVIADDHEIVRAGIKQLLAQRSDLSLVAEASDGLEAISAIKRHKPTIVLLDLSMPYANALNVFCETRRWSKHSKVIVFTGLTTSTLLVELYHEGVDSILLKEGENTDINQAIDTVLAGKRYITDKIIQFVTLSESTMQLTKREKQVLQLIVTGNTNAQISSTLGVSIKTIDNHRTNLMKKLDVHSVAELMAYALRCGLLE